MPRKKKPEAIICLGCDEIFTCFFDDGKITKYCYGCGYRDTHMCLKNRSPAAFKRINITCSACRKDQPLVIKEKIDYGWGEDED